MSGGTASGARIDAMRPKPAGSRIARAVSSSAWRPRASSGSTSKVPRGAWIFSATELATDEVGQEGAVGERCGASVGSTIAQVREGHRVVRHEADHGFTSERMEAAELGSRAVVANRGERGGSAVAVAAVNALLYAA